eukprot:570181-Rhodomonas_salina.2
MSSVAPGARPLRLTLRGAMSPSKRCCRRPRGSQARESRRERAREREGGREGGRERCEGGGMEREKKRERKDGASEERGAFSAQHAHATATHHEQDQAEAVVRRQEGRGAREEGGEAGLRLREHHILVIHELEVQRNLHARQ